MRDPGKVSGGCVKHGIECAWLLNGPANFPKEGNELTFREAVAVPVAPKLAIERPHLRSYGPEVQEALHLAWTTANHICAKRLIPFLPTLVESLEQHGHLHLFE